LFVLRFHILDCYLFAYVSLCICIFIERPIYEKTKPIFAFSALRSADSVKMSKRNLKKQSQYDGLWPEIRNTKPEIRNGQNGDWKTDSSTFYRVRFEKTKPICAGIKYRKVLYKRRLWKYTDPRSRRKQSQTNPISNNFLLQNG
jgi:hypothetical protein